ncbi:MAG: hypothetical protein EOP09_00255 [Proteobacteria bacterium]|nr:MAG: hypothetical protein EOP09_00255 [Pseudomonadota bacterium]
MAKKTQAQPQYRSYKQFAFRVSADELKQLHAEIEQLRSFFNKDRNPEQPTGPSVKVADVVLEALTIGFKELKKRKRWEFNRE